MTTESRKAQYRASKQKTRAEKRAEGYVYFSVQVLPDVKAKLLAYWKELIAARKV